MIVESGKYFLYRHIRLDTNQVFYVGIGTVQGKYNTRGKRYIRAHTRTMRNRAWKGVIKKTKYSIDILLETNDKDFLFRKETEFIRLYGRVDEGTGTLYNQTNGGEGAFGISRAVRALRLERMKKNGAYQRNNEHLAKVRPKKGCEAPWIARQCFLYDFKTGLFLKSFKSAKACAEYVGMVPATVNAQCRKELCYKFWVFTYTDYGPSVDVATFKVKKYFGNEILKMTSDGKTTIEIFDSPKKASLSVGLNPSAVSKAIKTGHLAGGFKWAERDIVTGEVNVYFHKWAHAREVCKIDKTDKTTVLEKYDSLISAGDAHGVTGEAIGRAIKQKGTSVGFYWKYAND
jgi:hypothetical protein